MTGEGGSAISYPLTVVGRKRFETSDTPAVRGFKGFRGEGIALRAMSIKLALRGSLMSKYFFDFLWPLPSVSLRSPSISQMVEESFRRMKFLV